MKRLSLILLAFLMIACTPAALEGDPIKQVGQGEPAVTQAPAVSQDTSGNTGAGSSDAAPAQSGTAKTGQSELPIIFDYFSTFDSSELDMEDWPTEGVMFTYDFDGDGEAKEISYKITHGDDNKVDIQFKDQVYTFDSVDLYGAILIDLDPGSSYLNLLIIVDEGSDDYLTAELHLENGKLTQGPIVYAECYFEDGKLLFWERTEILGTNFGCRNRAGDDLHPENEWLDLYYIPTEEELQDEEELGNMIEMGFVLEVIHDLPCERDGVSDFLTYGDYIYPVRFRGDGTAVECRTLEGETVIIYGENESGWEFKINGQEQDYYFTYIPYYD